MSDGWDESAEAWIADMGDEGDFGRQFVLDSPMLARVSAGPFADALDVGCGEGRFCRMLADLGIATTGIDPTRALIEHAQILHPDGDYRIGRAEALDFADASFDLVVAYMSLIDIPDASIPHRRTAGRPTGADNRTSRSMIISKSAPSGSAGATSTSRTGTVRYRPI